MSLVVRTPSACWKPSLERASLWNAWSEEEQMIQLAGYLRGRALQEWNLLRPDQRVLPTHRLRNPYALVSTQSEGQLPHRISGMLHSARRSL